MHANHFTRRAFLRGATWAAAGLAIPQFVSPSALGLAGTIAPSNRITLGCIGTGGMGTYDMSLFLQLPEVQLVALCDAKQPARERALQTATAAGAGPGIALYGDFRELVGRPDIDVVSVASTDHWHVLHALAAVRAGKDIYVEKPLGISIQQIKTLRDEVHRYGRMFQFGTQQRSMPQFHQACELALNGRIGKVHTIRVSAPPGFAERTGEAGYPIVPPPDDVDYDMWLGPAPWAPYTPKRIISPHWFHISSYALGYIAGWGIHHVDIAQWGNGTQLTGPVEIEGSGLFPTNDGLCDTALNWDVDMTYANGVHLSFTSDGGKNRHGIRFEGSDGWIHVDRSQITAEPVSVLQERIGPDEIHLPVSRHHQANLIEAVKTRQPTICPIDVAVRSDTLCHLGDIAMRLGRKLKWDPAKEEFVNDAQANAMTKRAMRSPWHL